MSRPRKHRLAHPPEIASRDELRSSLGPQLPHTSGPVNVFQRVIVWLFHLLVLTTPLFFAFSTDELFEFNKIMLTYFYVMVICAAWVGRMIFEKRFIWRHTALNYLIGIFLFSQVLSTIFSIHPYTSWFGYYSRFHGGLASQITYALLYWAFISNITRRELRALFLSTMLAGSLVSLYAIGEHFGHSFSCWLSSKGTSFGADCWVQDVQHRVFATFGQPNWLAAYALMLLSAVVGVLLSSWPSRWERSCYYGSYALLFWTLLYTRSRSGFLGFVVALLVITAGYALWWWLQRAKRNQSSILNQKSSYFWQQPAGKAGSILLGLTLIAALLSGTPYSPSLSELSSRQASSTVAVDSATTEPVVVNRLDIGGTDSGEIRKIVWQGALAVWRRYPVLGSGVETFAYSYYQDRPIAHNLVSEWDFLYNKAHNELLNFLATTGVVGLGSYLLLLCAFFVIAVTGFVRLCQANENNRASIVLALAAATAGLSVSNFFGFSTVVVTILQYLAFAVTMLLLIEPAPQPTPVSRTSLWQATLLVLVAVTTLFPLNDLFKLYRADQHYTAGKSLAQGDVPAAAVELTTAIKLSPREALFWDELGQLYAQAAVTSANASVSAELAANAIAASDQVIALNHRQLNFYKTRARIFIILSPLDDTYLEEAIKTLESAITLSPTDPKLLYNLGALKFQQGDSVSGFALLQKAIELKPNYGTALAELSRQEWVAGRQQAAVDHLEQLIEYSPDSKELDDLLASYSAEMKVDSDSATNK